MSRNRLTAVGTLFAALFAVPAFAQDEVKAVDIANKMSGVVDELGKKVTGPPVQGELQPGVLQPDHLETVGPSAQPDVVTQPVELLHHPLTIDRFAADRAGCVRTVGTEQVPEHPGVERQRPLGRRQRAASRHAMVEPGAVVDPARQFRGGPCL